MRHSSFSLLISSINLKAPPFLHLPLSPQISKFIQSQSQMPSDQLDDSDTEQIRRKQPTTMSKPSPKILSLILRAIIMSLLTSIFFLFVGIAAIFLTHLFLAGQHLRRRRQQSSNFQKPYTTGMSNEDLRQLPGFRFDNGSSEKMTDFELECVICLDRIKDGDLFRILPGCSHGFHLECIDTWLVKSSVCPTCRGRVCAGAEIGADVEC